MKPHLQPKRGRQKKKGTPTIVNLKLTLWPGEDDDLIHYFESIPAKKKAIHLIAALRNGGGLTVKVVDDVDDTEIENLLESQLF